MKRIINSSKQHWGFVLSEIFIIFGAVIFGEYFLRVIGTSILSLFVALPAIFIGLAVRAHFNSVNERRNKASF